MRFGSSKSGKLVQDGTQPVPSFRLDHDDHVRLHIQYTWIQSCIHISTQAKCIEAVHICVGIVSTMRFGSSKSGKLVQDGTQLHRFILV